MKVVRPLPGAAPYIGGKRRLAGHITEIIERIPHKLYAEPFVGMGGIFFRRRAAAKHEIINDYSGEVINFFRVMQRHCREMLITMRLYVSSRALFGQLIETPISILTDIERAARFYYLQRNCYGGKVSGKNFGVDPQRSRFNIRQLKKQVIAMHQRLAGVVIECLHYSEFIQRYDGPHVLFYLDPPYWNCENDYGKGVFSKDDFILLADQLANIKGKFLLSINDVPQVREIFKAFRIETVETVYSIGPNNKRVGELIISNTDW